MVFLCFVCIDLLFALGFLCFVYRWLTAGTFDCMGLIIALDCLGYVNLCFDCSCGLEGFFVGFWFDSYDCSLLLLLYFELVGFALLCLLFI